MNTTLGIPLESFNLDEREFERCKVWSAVIKHFSTIEDDSEVDFDEFEKEYKDEKLEDDGIDNGSGEISLDEEDNENNPLNHSVMQLRSLRSTLINAQSRSNGSLGTTVVPLEVLTEADENEDDFDMQEMLDQTLPILAERERKWKESGMLNVLNTFDVEKIERKVGSWLRINNSVLASHSKHNTQVPSADDDDSVHSIDTARYVLSNRKPRSSSCCSTIKSYRLLQSKRDALREKYAFSEDELEKALQRHTNGSQNRKSLRAQNDCVVHHLTNKIQKDDERGLIKLKKRRKLLNKQRARFYSSNRCCESSSSSEENLDDEGNEAYAKPFIARKRRRLPVVCATPLRTPMGKGAASLARACASVPRNLVFKCNLSNPLKPRKRASECCCFKEEKLCKLTEHLADTSTEDWLVENCDSPKKSPAAQNENIIDLKEVEETKAIEHAKPLKKKKKNVKISAEQKKRSENKISKNEKSKESSKESLLESTFEKELKQVIELSKQTFETEQKTIKNQIAKSKKQNAKKSKLKTKTQQPNNLSMKDEHNKFELKTVNYIEITDDTDASTCQRAEKERKIELNNLESEQNTHNIALPKRSLIEQNAIEITTNSPQKKTTKTKIHVSPEKVSHNEQNKCVKRQSELNDKQLPQLEISPSAIDYISPARLGLKPQPKSAKLKKIKKLTEKGLSSTAIRNETFFSQADKICNSTAVANDVIASKKQFPTDCVNSAATAPTRKTVDDPDCTVVSSTTDEPQPRKLTNSMLTSSNHINGDILLHTPHNRTLAPPQSFSDGVFSITEDHLSSLIGEKKARKFMKYYIGRRRFDANLSVYYRPPRQLDHINGNEDDDDDTDSDVDALEQIDHLGDIYVLSEK